ncbi:MAG: PorT family protein [Tannerellaceae bacterium]|jgi:hypothetical protein|nr:PorT family protein [Tannerellaceae bacterium]
MRSILFIIIAASLITAATQTAQAQQQISVGVKAGLNLTGMRMNENTQDALGDSKVGAGFNVGLTLDIPLTTDIVLQTGAELSYKNAKSVKYAAQQFSILGVIIPANENLTINMTPLFVQLPFYFAYKIAIDKDIWFMPRIGPYFAYGISGKLKPRAQIAMANFDISAGLPSADLYGPKPMMKNIDFGLGLGIGIEYSRYKIFAGYEAGLANLASKNFKAYMDMLTEDDFSLKTGNLYISLAFGF